MSKSHAKLSTPTCRTRVHIHRGKPYQVSEAHPVADFYQWLTENQIDALAANIRESGLEKPIHCLPDGRIIDGRNRELACLVAGIEPRYQTRSLATDAEIVAYIRAANEYRRHSSESQRAMTAARLANLKRGTNQHASKVDGAQAPSVSQGEAAEQFHISRDTVRRALIVLRNGVPGLVTAIDEDRLDVTTAAKIAALPIETQQAVASAANPKEAAQAALLACPTPPVPTPFDPVVASGDVFIKLAPDTPTVGSLDDESGTLLPGIPQQLANGQVWLGRSVRRRDMRLAYLIPSLNGGWFVVVVNMTANKWLTHKYALRADAAMNILTNPERYGFDVFAAAWQPTTRFVPSAINPLFTDPEYAPMLSEELKQFVTDETRREEEQAGALNDPDECGDTYHDFEY